ncbi:unnamed protein product [Ranitomeya imitator]|uniref:Tex-like protein N-terminal domain-containing protein n=1 Tax=Ranitomeya imitator TaxID=111125 RepID=A0ABN9MFP7_9NEOB|nr:unnamed protein product [Ranitomeya imitator]
MFLMGPRFGVALTSPLSQIPDLSLAVSASRTVTAGRKVKAEHSGCAFTFTLRPAVTECGKQTARDLTDTRIYPMFTLVTQGPRHRWSLESGLCDSSPATTLRFTYDHGQVISLVVIVASTGGEQRSRAQRWRTDSGRCNVLFFIFCLIRSDSEEDLSVEEDEWMPEKKVPKKRQTTAVKKSAAKPKTAAAPKPRKVPARKNAKASSAAEEARGTPQENEINMSKLSSKQETISIDRPIKKEILSPKSPKKKMANPAQLLPVKTERRSVGIVDFPSTSGLDMGAKVKNEFPSREEEEEPPDDFTFGGPPLKKMRTSSDPAGKPVKYKAKGSAASESSDMNWNIVEVLSERTNVESWVCSNLIQLFEDDNTIPFIARYRKELINNLDADTLREVQQGLEELRTTERIAETKGTVTLSDAAAIPTTIRIAAASLFGRWRAVTQTALQRPTIPRSPVTRVNIGEKREPYYNTFTKINSPFGRAGRISGVLPPLTLKNPSVPAVAASGAGQAAAGASSLPVLDRPVPVHRSSYRSVAKKAHSLVEKLKKEGKLHAGLHTAMLNCRSMDEIEHVYTPYKTGSKGTKAQRARQLGLESAAKALIDTPQQLNLHMYIKPNTEGRCDIRNSLQKIYP